MRKIKSIMMCAAAVLTMCFMFSNVIVANAATTKVTGNVYVEPYTDVKGNVKQTTKMRVLTYSIDSLDVEHGAGDKITNLKCNKKTGLSLCQTSYYSDGSSYGATTISVYATKTGTYKLTFDVVNSANQKRGSYTVTVQAVNTDSLIKKATFGSKTVVANSSTIKKSKKTTTTTRATKVTGSSGKLKITPNSQYKITGMVVVSVSKSGTYTYKKIKNGKKITLSKAYATINKDASGNDYSSTKKYTYIYVSYKDTFFGDTVTYSVSSARGRKEVKRVMKNALTGETSTTYSKVPTATITLWQY